MPRRRGESHVTGIAESNGNCGATSLMLIDKVRRNALVCLFRLVLGLRRVHPDNKKTIGLGFCTMGLFLGSH
jgi:hypothetical protein